MAYAFPLTAAQFFATLRIKEITFDIPESMEMSETGGGEVLTADLGTRLWQGEVQLGELTPDEAADTLAMLDVLRRSGASFMAYDVSRPAPRFDLTGTLLGALVPKLHTVAASTREIRISGLPPAYQLRRYDYVAFQYGSNPTRFALHRLAAAVVADGTGLTPLVEVSPNIRPGWTINSNVTLLRAACKAVLVPGSVQPGRRKAGVVTGASFKFMQTLR